MASEWHKGVRDVALTLEDDGRMIDVFVTEELTRDATLFHDDGVWYCIFVQGMQMQLIAVPMWRFK